MDWADIILAMDSAVAQELRVLGGTSITAKLRLYLDDRDVPDPFGKGDEAFIACAAILEAGARQPVYTARSPSNLYRPSMTNAGTLKLVVTGGGTGGHTYPALTTAQTAQRLAAAQGRRIDLTWVGVATGLEVRVAHEHQIPFKAIVAGKLRRRPSTRELVSNLADTARILYGVLQAIWFTLRNRPDVVLSTGGFVAVPIGLAAWLTRRRLVMHEQTVTLGLANRILARFATVIAVSHDSSLAALPKRARGRAVVTGNPIRPELLTGQRTSGLERVRFSAELPFIYVTGGAQGSAQINALLTQILSDLLAHAQVLHQCGTSGIHAAQSVAADLCQRDPALAARYRPVAYVQDELPDILAAADVVVARSGAGTIAELATIGKPAVLIPLVPSAADEQRRNAMHAQQAGAAICIDGEMATSEHLLEELVRLVGDQTRLAQMATAAKRRGRPDAAERLAELLVIPAGTTQG